MLVTGGPRVLRGEAAFPAHRLTRVVAHIADDRRRIIRKHAWHRRRVADVAVQDAEQ
jgi:hypothetical protein